MKTKILLSLFFCFLGYAYCTAGEGNLSKIARKSYRKVCKQLKADGWAVYDKKQSVDDAMLQYYLQLDARGDSVMQVIGMGQDRNVNKAFSQAQHRASVVQASQKEIKIKVVTDLIISSSSEKISNTSMLHAEQFINQQKPIVSLYRKNKDNYEVQLLYVIKN